MFTAFKRKESGVFFMNGMKFLCVCARVYVCVSMPLGHEVNALSFLYTHNLPYQPE